MVSAGGVVPASFDGLAIGHSVGILMASRKVLMSIQSDGFPNGTAAKAVIANALGDDPAISSCASWAQFVGVGSASARSVEDIDKSVRELRDEWPL